MARQQATRTCPQCGASVPRTTRFCGSCGRFVPGAAFPLLDAIVGFVAAAAMAYAFLALEMLGHWRFNGTQIVGASSFVAVLYPLVMHQRGQLRLPLAARVIAVCVAVAVAIGTVALSWTHE